MNRLKKEIRKKGVMLESDYPFMPFNGIEAVKVDSERATLSTYTCAPGGCAAPSDVTLFLGTL